MAQDEQVTREKLSQAEILVAKSHTTLQGRDNPLVAPQKTLDMKEEISAQIDIDQDIRLLAWIPLDWARAHALVGDVERSIADARDFYTRVTAMKSPHAVSRAYSFVQDLEAAGFGDVQAVRDFKHELIEAQQDKRTEKK